METVLIITLLCTALYGHYRIYFANKVILSKLEELNAKANKLVLSINSNKGNHDEYTN